MAIFLDRRRRAGRFLEWKVGIFAGGAVLGLAGIFLDEPALRIGGIAVLLTGMLVRFLPGAGAGEADVEEAEGVEDDPDASGPEPRPGA